MLAFNHIVMAYIVNMVSQQVLHREKETEFTPTVTKRYLAYIELVVFPPHFRMSDFKMFDRKGNSNQLMSHSVLRCGDVINGPLATKIFYYYSFLSIQSMEQPSLGMQVS